MKHSMKYSWPRKTTKVSGSQLNTMNNSTARSWPNSSRTMNWWNSDALQPTFTERHRSTTSLFSCHSRTRLTGMPSKLDWRVRRGNWWKSCWSSSLKRTWKSSSLCAPTPAMNWSDLMWCWSMPGDIRCSTMLCPLWSRSPRNSLTRLTMSRRRPRRRRRRKRSSSRTRRTSHLKALQEAWAEW